MTKPLPPPLPAVACTRERNVARCAGRPTYRPIRPHLVVCIVRVLRGRRLAQRGWCIGLRVRRICRRGGRLCGGGAEDSAPVAPPGPPSASVASVAASLAAARIFLGVNPGRGRCKRWRRLTGDRRSREGVLGPRRCAPRGQHSPAAVFVVAAPAGVSTAASAGALWERHVFECNCLVHDVYGRVTNFYQVGSCNGGQPTNYEGPCSRRATNQL